MILHSEYVFDSAKPLAAPRGCLERSSTLLPRSLHAPPVPRFGDRQGVKSAVVYGGTPMSTDKEMLKDCRSTPVPGTGHRSVRSSPRHAPFAARVPDRSVDTCGAGQLPAHPHWHPRTCAGALEGEGADRPRRTSPPSASSVGETRWWCCVFVLIGFHFIDVF